jgi:hypothetical protein
MFSSRLPRYLSIGVLLLLSTLVLSTGVVTPVTPSSSHSIVDSPDELVSVSDMKSTQTVTIDVSVNDSSNGQDSTSVPITVDSEPSEVPSDEVPSDLPSSVSAEQYTAFAGDDGEITQPDAINGFNGWFEDGSYNGVEFGQEEALDLFNYWFNSG